MAIVLALLTAAVFGIGDFCGGMAAKRARVLQVVAGSHLIGAVGATLVAVVVAERFDWGDAALGAAGGAFGVVGVALLYRRLALGPMSVVAPLTAITSAVVPSAWGIIGGERLSWLGLVGVGFGLLAVLLVSIVAESEPAEAMAVTASGHGHGG
ncbi:MAG: EamA family transporter, partial [Acidimicrobiales bacterium]